MKTILILIGVIIVMGFVFWLIYKSKNKRIKSLLNYTEDLESSLKSKNEEIARKKLSMEKIGEHQERIKFTEEELAPIKKQVKEANSEEDILAAIGNITAINNRRL
jgi:tRNA A37 threonylcarbamoyladenosine modification protein TsaB